MSAAWEAEVREAAARKAEHFDIRCRPKQLDQCYGPEQFDAIMEQWPAVQVYLRDEAPRFDSNRLVANIQDEAAKAAQRLKLRADPSGQPGGDGQPTQPGSAKLSPRELAIKYGVDSAALRKRLDRWWYAHDAGYVEVSNAAKNEPRYLYDESAVMPVIEALKAKPVGRKRAADGHQKKV